MKANHCSLIVGVIWLSLRANTAIGLPQMETTGAESSEWTAHGKDATERRFSPLTQINAMNAGRLGLVWTYDLQSTRGVEATPLVVNGVMYVTAPWSIVHAVDARTPLCQCGVRHLTSII
jgi:quinohemoprotein ethanol dehydrogenase